MQLSKLYSNNGEFKNISFNLNGINVIYAEVKTDIKDKKNQHNLGKTKVAELIDFLLLKGVTKKDSFLLKTNDENSENSIFVDYVFFLEILLNDGKYLTIKRAVENNTKISFSVNEKRSEGFKPPLKFDFDNIPFEKAKLLLGELLNFDFFFNKNYDYRKALNYNLRTPPEDYADVFQLSKFSNGKHKYWKPFIFDLLGFDGELLLKKYDSDDEIQEIQGFIETVKKEYSITKKDRDTLVDKKLTIEQKNKEIEEKIDNFNFYQQDKELIENGINDIETAVSEYNTVSYTLNYEIDRLNKSIQNNFAFEIDKVKKVFEESGIYFGTQIKNDYDKLIDFNNKITSERNKLIKSVLRKKQKELSDISTKLLDLNLKRENLLSLIQDTDTFKKFKTYQKELAKKEDELLVINQKIANIDLIYNKEEEIEKKKEEIDGTIKRLREIYKSTESNEKYSDIRLKFKAYYKEIMDEDANISWHLNSSDNIDFPSPKVHDKANKQKTTSKDEGNTYKKLLCVCFDLAILTSYNSQSYFQFVYHDDVLSQQDNGIKNRLLKLVKRLCSEYKLQYILSVIKSDLPMDSKDELMYFPDDEVVLKLNDLDEKGTLFGFEF